LRRAEELGITAMTAKPPFVFSSDVDLNDEDDETFLPASGSESEVADVILDEGQSEEESADGMRNVKEDLCVVSGAYLLRTFKNVDLSPTSPFVKVFDGLKKTIIISKSTLCWMYSEGVESLSSDRLQRVKASQTLGQKNVGTNQTTTQDLREPREEEYVAMAMGVRFGPKTVPR